MSFKENDIRPADLMKMKEPALEHDKKFLRDRIPQFVQVPCPACGSMSRTAWATKEGFSYDLCNDCRTIYMNPRAPENILYEFYDQSENYAFWNKHIFPASEQARKQKIFVPRAKRLQSYCQQQGVKGGTLLEIGSAFGTFCEAAKELNYFERIIAVEPTPDLAATCRKKGIETLQQPVEQLTLPENSVDVVASFEVIEHLGNPQTFVQQSIRYLRKGGLFICTCPNGEGLGTLVLKEKAKVVDHEHVNYFNPKSLSLLLERNGLEVLEVSTPGELDVELLVNAFKEDQALMQGVPLFNYLTHVASSEQLLNFQQYLKENLLSSHMWIIAKRR
ncbi:MAG: class I SAM-dependent methyltransferase [Bacteroidota bacterium]